MEVPHWDIQGGATKLRKVPVERMEPKGSLKAELKPLRGILFSDVLCLPAWGSRPAAHRDSPSSHAFVVEECLFSQLELPASKRCCVLQADSGDAGWESCCSVVVGVKLDGCHLILCSTKNSSLPGTSFIVNSSFENIVVTIYKSRVLRPPF